MTKTQELNQCDGPNRPTVQSLAFILSQLPKHLEIRAISIKGQGGEVIVETYHDEMDSSFSWVPDGFIKATNELIWRRK